SATRPDLLKFMMTACHAFLPASDRLNRLQSLQKRYPGCLYHFAELAGSSGSAAMQMLKELPEDYKAQTFAAMLSGLERMPSTGPERQVVPPFDRCCIFTTLLSSMSPGKDKDELTVNLIRVMERFANNGKKFSRFAEWLLRNPD